ncbi:hypothetical protein GCM10009809_38280 [Isoptericola hypogeus]|uniref:Uncharacterized protein n=1 Tax=Isoptericola hypogeus TaxID=300179 RepID=A0ABN2JV38_9MICO
MATAPLTNLTALTDRLLTWMYEMPGDWSLWDLESSARREGYDPDGIRDALNDLIADGRAHVHVLRAGLDGGAVYVGPREAWMNLSPVDRQHAESRWVPVVFNLGTSCTGPDCLGRAAGTVTTQLRFAWEGAR